MTKDLEQIFTNSQKKVIDAFSKIESSKKAKITFDKWKRPEGGGGQTFVIESGAFFGIKHFVDIGFVNANVSAGKGGLWQRK